MKVKKDYLPCTATWEMGVNDQQYLSKDFSWRKRHSDRFAAVNDLSQ